MLLQKLPAAVLLFVMLFALQAKFMPRMATGTLLRSAASSAFSRLEDFGSLPVADALIFSPSGGPSIDTAMLPL